MTTPTMNELRRLSSVSTEPAVSLMQSVQASNLAWNITSWKNLVQSAEESLLRSGMQIDEIRGLLEPATALLEKTDFWTKSGDSVACFLSKDERLVVRTPLPLPALAVTGKRFHLLPFLPTALEDEKFFILAISANHVRLLEATRFVVSERDLAGPRSLQESLGDHEPQKQGGFHTAKAPGATGAGGTSIHHGQGAASDGAKDAKQRFCKMVAHAVSASLKGEHGPLVLAGEVGIASIYRAQNEYPHLLENELGGNPDRTSNEQLRDEAFAIAHEVLDVRRKSSVERCVAAAAKGGLAMDLSEVVHGALAGRIETLLAPTDRPRWGRLDDVGADVHLHADREPDDEELTNVAALGALQHRSFVTFTSVDEVPSTIRLPAAILRAGF